MNGAQCCRELIAIRPDVRVILASGYDEHDATRDFPAGALAGFLKKPYGPPDLFARIRSAMGG